MPVQLQLLAFQTIMQEPLPPIDWLIEPLFSQGSRAVVFGEFGCMKSWLLLDLGLSLASGQQWLGHFSVPRPRSVLYVDEEMPEGELRRRVKRLGLGREQDGQDLPLRVMSHSGVRFSEPMEVENLLQILQRQQFDPEVIIVETLRRVLEGSENDAEAVSAFWHSVSPILTAGKTLIVSHHMRKPNAQGVNDSRYRASGSTDILAGADMAFAVERIDERLLQVECVKSRVVAEADTYRVGFQEETEDGPVRMVFDDYLEDAGSTESSPQRIGELIESFLQVQSERGARTADIDEWLAAHGISHSQGEKARRFLKRSGRATNPRYGYWQWRDAGLATEIPTSANPRTYIGSEVAEASVASDHRGSGSGELATTRSAA